MLYCVLYRGVEVSVGYQYRNCSAVVWDTQATRLPGFPVDISDIGGWNLNIHHHYHADQGDVTVCWRLGC